MTDQLMRYGRWDTHLKPFIYNYRPGNSGNMIKWHLAKGRVLAGTSRAVLALAGNSKIAGSGAGTTDAPNGGTTFSTGAASKTKSKFLCDRAAKKFPVSRQTISGMNGYSSMPLIRAYDTRITASASWVLDGFPSVGGQGFKSATPNVDPLTITPDAGVVVDTVDTYYLQASSTGTFTVSDGATVVDTVNTTAGAGAFTKKTSALSSRAAGKTISWNRTTANANSVYLQLINAYDSLTPAVDVFNWGWHGSKSSDWIDVSNAWSPMNAITLVAPALFVLAIQDNDINQGVSVATFKANAIAILSKALLTGSAIIVVGSMGQQPTWGDAATQAAFEQAAYDIADQLDIPLINENAYIGGFTAGNANALYADGIHETALADAMISEIYDAVAF